MIVITQKITSSCLLLLLSTSMVWACSCSVPQTVAIGWRYSDLIVEGEVLAVKQVTGDTLAIGADDLVIDSLVPSWMVEQKMEYTIRVVEWYKGEALSTTINLQTGLGSGDCGYSFRLGARYLIYANRLAKGVPWTADEGTYSTDICMRTKLYYAPEAQELQQIRDYSVGCRCPKRLLPATADSTLCMVVNRAPFPKGRNLQRWKSTIVNQLVRPQPLGGYVPFYYELTMVVDERGGLKRVRTRSLNRDRTLDQFDAVIAAQLIELVERSPAWVPGRCSGRRVPVKVRLVIGTRF